MDINFLRGLATVTVLIAFTAICIWAYSGKRKEDFERAANLPFADDHIANENRKEERK